MTRSVIGLKDAPEKIFDRMSIGAWLDCRVVEAKERPMETTLANPQFNRSVSRKQLRAGLALSALPVLFLVFDSVIKFTAVPAVTETFEQLGYAPSTAPLIGGIELVCLVTYVIPR